MSPGLMLILATTAGIAAPAATAPETCPSKDSDKIVVCAQRGQAYRLDPSIGQAQRQAEMNSQSATSVMHAAQANCSQSPAGCGKGLESLDLANVAFVALTTAARAARGGDWRKAFRTGGPDEYQLYQQAKRIREVEQEERAAREMKRKAEQAEREASASPTASRR